MLMYAWNSEPIPITDITQKMVICGRNFAFPIDFSSTTAVRLTSSKKWVESYAARQAELLRYG